jgi:hypothetical protein
MCGMMAAWVAQGGEQMANALPSVRAERPRLFVRAKAWDGPSVEKIRGWMDRPEYKQAMGQISTCGNSIRYLILDDQTAGKQAAATLQALTVPSGPGTSPSYDGIEVTQTALLYDWLRNHPDVNAAGRQAAIAHLEWWGDYFKKFLSPGCVPFYSRNNGALSGLTAVGLALHGDSPKAQGYLEHAFQYLRENTGTIRQMEDGATGGATYGLMHQFTDNANIVAMWRSATDWDAAKWIKENQGNWLERQLLYQIWFTYPNGWYWKEGDTWGGKSRLKDQCAMQVAAVTHMYRNGFGRTYLDQMFKWFGNATYYKDNVWMFVVHNNPEIAARPLADLGRAQVFSPQLHGYVSWRSSWDADATCVTFKAGDNVDHHGTWDTGKFEIFRNEPLAIKNGYYGKYMNSKHLYYKSPWSANVVIFDGPVNHGWQPRMPDLDSTTSWSTWKAARDKLKHPVCGRIVASEANDKYARVLADLSGATFPSGSRWTREIVFLGYQYVVVLDRVKPGADTRTRWLLQSVAPARIETGQGLAVIDNGKARLFVKTLLPAKARMENACTPDKWFVHKDQKTGEERSFGPEKGKPDQVLGAGRLDVIPPDENAACVYLHVLFPTDTNAADMPACSFRQDGQNYTVKVAALEYTFQWTQEQESR